MTTSDRKRSANRANAARSTGPRTQAGKTRASRNALRHGLNLPLPLDEYGEELSALTERLQGGIPAKAADAKQAAIAQLQLERVRRIKALVLLEGAERAREADVASAAGSDAGDEISLALADRLARLLTLDGYERKALSRRKKAFRALYS